MDPNNSMVWKRFLQILGQCSLEVFKNIGPEQESVDVEETPFSKWSNEPQMPVRYPITVSIPYSGKMNGNLWFIFSRGLAARISQAFLGTPLEDGDPIIPDLQDALAETANQLSGSYNTQFRKAFGEPLNVQSPKLGGLPDILRSVDGNYLGSKAIVAVIFLDAAKKEAIGILPDNEFAAIFEDAPAPAKSAPAPEPAKAPPPPMPPPKAPMPGAAFPAPPPPAGSQPAAAPMFQAPAPPDIPNIDLILDIDLDVVMRIGSRLMLIKDILNLTSGAVIELDKSISDPVEIRVNDKPIAYGEVVVAEGNYAIRITKIANRMERIRSLG